MLGDREERTKGLRSQAQDMILQAYDRGYKAGQKERVRIDQDGTLYAERVMTPAEFEEKMWRIKIRQDSTPEYNNIDADRLMCELLTDLGYGGGVRFFREMEKWYS